MTTRSPSKLHRLFVSARRVWADMERGQRAALELRPAPRRRH